MSNPQHRMKIKMKMSSTIGDLVKKIQQFTASYSDQRKIFLWRIAGRGGRGSNKFHYVRQETDDDLKRELFRIKKETEVLYVRFSTAQDKTEQSNLQQSQS